MEPSDELVRLSLLEQEIQKLKDDNRDIREKFAQLRESIPHKMAPTTDIQGPLWHSEFAAKDNELSDIMMEPPRGEIDEPQPALVVVPPLWNFLNMEIDSLEKLLIFEARTEESHKARQLLDSMRPCALWTASTFERALSAAEIHLKRHIDVSLVVCGDMIRKVTSLDSARSTVTIASCGKREWMLAWRIEGHTMKILTSCYLEKEWLTSRSNQMWLLGEDANIGMVQKTIWIKLDTNDPIEAYELATVLLGIENEMKPIKLALAMFAEVRDRLTRNLAVSTVDRSKERVELSMLPVSYKRQKKH